MRFNVKVFIQINPPCARVLQLAFDPDTMICGSTVFRAISAARKMECEKLRGTNTRTTRIPATLAEWETVIA